MNVYTYREMLERINAAEDQFPGNGPTVALLYAVIEQNQLIDEHIKSIKNKLDYIRLAVEEIADE